MCNYDKKEKVAPLRSGGIGDDFNSVIQEAVKSDISKIAKVCVAEIKSETNLSWYGIFLRLEHTYNLAHFGSLLRIWINTSQSSQKSSF